MTSNGFSNDDYDLTPSSMKYRTLDDDVEPGKAQQQHSPARAKGDEKFRGTPCTIKEWIFIVLLVIVIIVIMAFGISTIKSQSSPGSPSAQTTAGIVGQYVPKSCADARNHGITNSGIISIKPDDSMAPFQVYCDMSAVGGGWTMVASIHEDDVSQKCGPGDMWSSNSRSTTSYGPYYYPDYYHIYTSSRNFAYNSGSFSSEGFQHWRNLITFGEPSGATSADYKSKAYYSVPGSNMMIWHVPNDARLATISNEAFFKYYTDSNFLANYGSTLQALYSKYAPLNRLVPQGLEKKFLPCLATDWSNYTEFLSSNPSRPRFGIPPPSPGPSSTTSPTATTPPVNPNIDDDQFFISINNGTTVQLQRGSTNNVSSQIDVAFTNKAPWAVLAWIRNDDSSVKTILFTVKRKFGASTRSRYASYTSTNDFSAQFQYVCSTTKCSVMFIMTSSKLWDSRTPSNRFNNTQLFQGTMNITSAEKRFMIGHVDFPLLSSGPPSSRIMRRILSKLMTCFGQKQTFDLDSYKSISTQAKFIKGSMPSFTTNVTAGYIEMRKYDHLGYPFALCPGVRLQAGANPALHCVGSVQTHYTLRNKCGDFAAWDQLLEHNKKRNPSGATDLTSTLLLFIR